MQQFIQGNAKSIRQLEEKVKAGETDVRICYWTCDDGPTYSTQEFLNAAREMGVYLTFFTSREANASAWPSRGPFTANLKS